MKDVIPENEILRVFRERAMVELKFAIDDLRWWKERVASGLVKPDLAKGYIEAAKRVINIKRHVLGFPKFPC